MIIIIIKTNSTRTLDKEKIYQWTTRSRVYEGLSG